MRGGVGEQRADEDGAEHPLGGKPRQLELVLGARREAHHHRRLRAGRVHHGQAVAGELDGPVAPWVSAAIRAAVAETVHHQHPEVAREVGDLHLPVARVEQRPGRQQEDRLLALAVDLVEQPLPVALDEAFAVRVARAALLAVAADDRPVPRRHRRDGSSVYRRGVDGRVAGSCLSGLEAHGGVAGSCLPVRGAHGRASSTRLKGVSAARRTRLKPPSPKTSVRRCSPAWAPSAKPTSWLKEAGVQSIVEPP